MYRIVQKERLNSTTYDFWIHAPEIARRASAGQFIHILPTRQLLRRPISICEIKGDDVRFVMDVVGKGTCEIAEVNTELDVIGPLGKGFTLNKDKKCLIIGGGIGVIPLLQLYKGLPNAEVVLGFRSEDHVLLKDDFKKAQIVTSGYVTDIAREIIDDFDCIYACGPKPMLKAVTDLAVEFGKWCEVSLEERMACGVGACVGCVVRTKNDGYLRVCKDGPVFLAEEVDWDG